jgi:outer membrane protein assembly factor BamB
MKRLGLGLAVSLTACHSTPIPTVFSTQWLNDSGSSIAAIEARVRDTPRPPSVNVAVGVTDSSIIVAPLDGGRTWIQPALPDTIPSIAGELVLYSSRGTLTALDAKTGAKRWNVDVSGYWLRGAGDDGKLTAITLGTSDRKKSLFLAVTHGGAVQTRIETPNLLGRPAARGGIALVPWQSQYVSAIDMETGEEEGRLLTREQVSYALSAAGEIFFGEKAMLHLDDKIRYASTNQSERTALPDRVLPGRPIWLGSGGNLPIIDTSARAKIRIIAGPAWNGAHTHFASDSFVSTYFRTVMGFDARSAELRWTQALTSPVIAGGAGASGFVLCTADGKLIFVGATGGTSGGSDLGAPLRACTVEASSFTVPNGAAPGTLAAQIDRALNVLDPEMAAAQAFLVSELGRLSDPSVTKTLIDLTSSSRVAPDIRLRARELLAQRRSGPEEMLKSLERHYDFLSGDLLPPPVGPLADALAAMNEQRAAPLLARHLNDPSTESADLARAAHALITLATPAEAPSLRTFFALYRATADEPLLVEAVVSVAKALLRVGGAEDRALIERASRDPLTQPEVMRQLAAIPAAPAQAPRSTRDPALGAAPSK